MGLDQKAYPVQVPLKTAVVYSVKLYCAFANRGEGCLFP